jgi:phosphatidylglycerophosphatase A
MEGAAAARQVASLGGIGLLKPAPGTWGSAVVLPLAWLGPLPCLVLAALLTAVGIWALQVLARGGGAAAHDPGWVVVDEGAGMLLALAAVPAAAAGWAFAGWVLAAFLLFRLFDIVKCGPVGWADRRQGPVWVMLDDVAAGAMAAAVLLALRLAGLG